MTTTTDQDDRMERIAIRLATLPYHLQLRVAIEIQQMLAALEVTRQPVEVPARRE